MNDIGSMAVMYGSSRERHREKYLLEGEERGIKTSRFFEG
jgi:hypothetical protein